MREQLALLRKVQKFDLELDESQHSLTEIQNQLQNHKNMLQKLALDLDNQKSVLTETIALKAQRQDELAEAEERFAKSKERLMNISSTKEYNAVEKEMEQLKRKSEELREQLEHLKEAIGLNEEHIKQKENKINELRSQIFGIEQEAEGKFASLRKEISKKKSKSASSRNGIKPGIIRRYDFIRNRRGGKAIVAAKDSHCEGCFMALPPQLYIQIQRGESLESCPSCQCILYFYEDALSD